MLKLDKPIIIENKKIKKGKFLDDFYIYDLHTKKYYNAKKVIINKKIYYYYEKNKKIIVSKDFNKKYTSINYLTNDDCNIIKQSDNYIYFYNLKNNKKYKYELVDDEEIISDIPYRNILLVEGNKNIKIVDTKGNVVKIIKNKKILNYYYNDKNGKLIIITGRLDDDIYLKGSYVAE